MQDGEPWTNTFWILPVPSTRSRREGKIVKDRLLINWLDSRKGVKMFWMQERHWQWHWNASPIVSNSRFGGPRVLQSGTLAAPAGVSPLVKVLIHFAIYLAGAYTSTAWRGDYRRLIIYFQEVGSGQHGIFRRVNKMKNTIWEAPISPGVCSPGDV